MKPEIDSRTTEASYLPVLHEFMAGGFQYYNQQRRHSSMRCVGPRDHLKHTLEALGSQSRITAATHLRSRLI